MNTSTNVVRLRQPEEFEDPLTDILRSGARRLLAQAVELEAEAFLARMQDLKLPDGRDRLVRHGTTKGRPTKTSAIKMPRGVKAMRRSRPDRGRPIQPVVAYSEVRAMPATAVGSPKGRSMSASTKRRPGNR